MEEKPRPRAQETQASHHADPLVPPTTDPTSIFEHFRGSYGTELLTAAVAHFNVFDLLRERPMPIAELRETLSLKERPMVVLVTALRAMKLIELNEQEQLCLTPLAAEHLVPEREYFVGDYVALAAASPGVLNMVERLRTNRLAGLPEAEAVLFSNVFHDWDVAQCWNLIEVYVTILPLHVRMFVHDVFLTRWMVRFHWLFTRRPYSR